MSARRPLPPRRGRRRGWPSAACALRSTARSPAHALPLADGTARLCSRPLDTRPLQFETIGPAILSHVKRSLILALLAVMACRNAHFEEEEAKWRADRRARLTSDNSWLTLVGLHWLNPGPNEITIAGTPPLTLRFDLANGTVTVEPSPQITIGGKPVTAPTP